VEDEPATVANRENPAAIKACGLKFMSHIGLSFFET
jgi:hypothetical protein